MLIIHYAQAQNRTNVWELGYFNTLVYPNCEMRYMSGAMDTISISRIMALNISNTSICDTLGNLLFYTNGLIIGNSEYDTLQNSINFNPGIITSNSEPQGMKNSQGALIIPDPGDMQRYYLFHESGEYFIAHNQNEAQPLYLSYSVVDMKFDGGLGRIVDTLKNVKIIEDTLTWGGLTACKHANGRDWWIILHRYYNNMYYKLLVTPLGIQGPFTQSIGFDITSDVVVQATFSPDGSKYCFTNFAGGVDYLQFDRCTGEFSNAVSFINPDSFACRGNSFSPNNRFLYVSTLFNLYQYDTWENNMVENRIHVAAWDTFYDGTIPVYFFMHQLAPDGKIYMSSWNGVKYLNVINDPDNLGLACNFTAHSYVLPTWTWNIPSFPNYDLGPLIGSPCDTLFLSNSQTLNSNASFRISLNPVSDWLNIIYSTEEDGVLSLLDINGKKVAETSLFHYFKNRLLNVSQLPAGVYLAVVTQNGEKMWSEKVVVVH